jgi:uncharacterized protein (TIGR00730 family)
MTTQLDTAPEMTSGDEIRSVCLYCGSSDLVDPAYLEAAREFGTAVANAGLRLVYGGGGVGLMGAGAKAAHAAGGKVLGIMPQFLRGREHLFDDVETRVVISMHERKMMMFEESDAFVVMPGGIGTLEEVVELLSWRRLDLHKKPIIFLNMDGFWNPLFELINRFKNEGFAPAAIDFTYTAVSRVDEVLDAIAAMKTHTPDIDTRRVV